MDGRTSKHAGVSELVYDVSRLPLTTETCRLGDKKFKPFGVTPEPEVRTKLLKGNEFASHASLFDILVKNNRSGMGIHSFRLRRYNLCSL
jgi:hypothetical protein